MRILVVVLSVFVGLGVMSGVGMLIIMRIEDALYGDKGYFDDEGIYHTYRKEEEEECS